MPNTPKKRKDMHHDWTPFEMHTLLCLIAKGEHCWAPSEKKSDAVDAQKHAYLNVATLLNKAVHHKDYKKDIDKREVARMIDIILQEKKGAMAFISRQPSRRLTRGMRQVWERNPPINFTGSKFEWEHGRKAKVLGLQTDPTIAHDVDVRKSIEDAGAQGDDAEEQAYYWNQARALIDETAGSSNSSWGGPPPKGMAPSLTSSVVPSNEARDTDVSGLSEPAVRSRKPLSTESDNSYIVPFSPAYVASKQKQAESLFYGSPIPGEAFRGMAASRSSSSSGGTSIRMFSNQAPSTTNGPSSSTSVSTTPPSGLDGSNDYYSQYDCDSESDTGMIEEILKSKKQTINRVNIAQDEDK
ncbi:hypothetical protein B7463_g8287, partial [Scytalidium lignicola]